MTEGDVELKGIRRGEKREEKTLGGPQGDKTRLHERESSYKRRVFLIKSFLVGFYMFSVFKCIYQIFVQLVNLKSDI